mmetsp:Transcript_86001/g.224208  ORF Transcript_86001/g.224208 Transcript_86001/m.224208 type:complete len:207 (+) Transcript_86001:771-1391(+)
MLAPLRLVAVLLCEEQRVMSEELLATACPFAEPGLVRPRQHEGHIGLPIAEQGLRYLVHDFVIGSRRRACEPIVVIAKSMDPMCAGELALATAHIHVHEVIVAKATALNGKWFVYACRIERFEQRPLCEAIAPKPVVLGHSVVLWKIQSNDFGSGWHLGDPSASRPDHGREQTLYGVLWPLISSIAAREAFLELRQRVGKSLHRNG